MGVYKRNKPVFRGPFHKSLYERVLFYEFVEPALNYMYNEFVALTTLCETGPRFLCFVTYLRPTYAQAHRNYSYHCGVFNSNRSLGHCIKKSHPFETPNIDIDR